MLELKNVNAGYGKLQILFDLTLEVKEGAITAVLGSNGCGKSTAMRTVIGLLRPYSGSITFCGEEISGKSTQAIVRRGVSFVTQGKDVFPSLTVKENLLLGGYILKNNSARAAGIDQVLEVIPHLKKKLNTRAGILSGGEQQMLSIARGLMQKPKLLILDEPSAALSPKTADEVYQLILEIHASGVSILLVEQNVRQALRIAHYAYILSEGHVAFSDTAENIRNGQDVRSFYFKS